jgi:hypothetical protein
VITSSKFHLIKPWCTKPCPIYDIYKSARNTALGWISGEDEMMTHNFFSSNRNQVSLLAMLITDALENDQPAGVIVSGGDGLGAPNGRLFYDGANLLDSIPALVNSPGKRHTYRDRPGSRGAKERGHGVQLRHAGQQKELVVTSSGAS